MVLGQGQVPAQVGGAFEPVQLAFGAAVRSVGVQHGEEAAGELPELGGVESFGLGEQELHSAGTQVGVGGEGVDAAFDHLGLEGGEPAVGERLPHGRQQWPVDCGGEAEGGGAGALVSAGDRGEEVLGGGPAGGLDRAGGFELADHPELQRVQGRLDRFDLRDGVHQLAPVPGRPQRLGQVTDLGTDLGQGSRDTGVAVFVGSAAHR